MGSRDLCSIFFGFWDDFGASVRGREGGGPIYGWAGTERWNSRAVCRRGCDWNWKFWRRKSAAPDHKIRKRSDHCGHDFPPQITSDEYVQSRYSDSEFISVQSIPGSGPKKHALFKSTKVHTRKQRALSKA